MGPIGFVGGITTEGIVIDEVFGAASLAGSFAGSAGLGISFGASIVGVGATVPGTGGNAHPPVTGAAPITMLPDDA